jgi:hypothetical protein
MKLTLSLLTCAGLAVGTWSLIGCNSPTISNATDDTNNTDSDTGGDSTGGGGTDNSDANGGDGSGGDDTNNGSGNFSNPDTFSFTGKISPSAAAKRRVRQQNAGDPTYIVVAQSAATYETYKATTDADGTFQLDLPPSEQGNLFTVTILNEAGRAEGPIVFGEDGNNGKTGIDLASGVTLGEIALPDNPGDGPITPGADFDADDQVASDVLARLDANGAPVGSASLGKGDAADGSASNSARQILDKDKDGLPDFVDADNDGNGIADDFDNNASDVRPNDGVRLNFFTNLKIAADRMNIYYNGTDADREAALETDTVITFEVATEPGAAKQIQSVRLLDSPAPTYLPDATLLNSATLWSSGGYAINTLGNSFQAFITPHAVLNAGDSFTVEVTFDDNSTRQYTKMINYVFTNIPRLISAGAGASQTPFTGQQPFDFDGTQDLTFVFQPPKDENGDYIPGLDWRFEFFFLDSGGAQIQNIDGAATWPTPIVGWEANNHAYTVTGPLLSLSSESTYTLTLPKELFVDNVTLQGGGTQAVANFQIDIAAQKSGNAAIKLNYHKQ